MYYIGGIEMAKRRLGFGIIGCGMIAEYHVSALEDLHDKAKIIVWLIRCAILPSVLPADTG